MRCCALKLVLLGGLLTAGLCSAAVPETPLIQPRLTTLIEQERCVPENDRGHCARIALAVELSGIAWLDHALLQKLGVQSNDQTAGTATNEAYIERVRQQAANWMQENYAEVLAAANADEPYSLTHEHDSQLRFLYQRDNLAFYRQFDYDYYGGAHGMHASNYMLFDLNARQELQLQDILLPGREGKLTAALREVYLQKYSQYVENWLTGSEQEQLDKMLVDNFILTDEGLTFVYPLYELAPYAEGEARLTLGAYSLRGLLKPEYLFGY